MKMLDSAAPNSITTSKMTPEEIKTSLANKAKQNHLMIVTTDC